MKYLIKHKKEFALTIVWFVILAYVLYDGFKNGREVQSVIETIVGITVWYLNNPTSVEGSSAKISMLEDKATRGLATPDAEEPEDASLESEVE